MSALLPVVRKKTTVVARDLRMSFREIDPGVLAPRVAAAVFLFAGVFAMVVNVFVPQLHEAGTIVPIAIASSLFGLIAFFWPWQRYSPRVQLVMPAFAFVLFAWGGLLVSGAGGPYLALLPLPFVFVGFTQPPGTATLISPLAAIALVVAGRFDFDASVLATLVFVLPMSVGVAEVLAFAQVRRNRAEDRVEQLLDAVRVLARCEDTRSGAHLTAALAADLLGAEAVAVLLADRPGSHRYLNRAFFGHPALAEAAPLLVDALGEQGTLPNTTTRFVADPGRVRSLAPAARCVRALALLPLPADDGTEIGLVIAMWASNRRQLPASARQAAELLSDEAGRMFQRMRDSAALVHDAETDPLTELANRRTFQRSLEVMQPGDALVIVDLDHFKRVNDRYGHQVGDNTLRLLASCLRGTARQVDCVARYGGEEFAMVLPEAGASGAKSMLRRVRREWVACDGRTTFSAGIAVHEEGRSSRDTLRLADEALYAAKENGRNRDVLALASAVDVALPS